LECKTLYLSGNTDAGKFAKEKLKLMNGLNFMVNIGSKGNYINICQIMAAVGQQSIADKMNQGRVPFGLEFRTTPHFTKFDHIEKNTYFWLERTFSYMNKLGLTYWIFLDHFWIFWI